MLCGRDRYTTLMILSCWIELTSNILAIGVRCLDALSGHTVSIHFARELTGKRHFQKSSGLRWNFRTYTSGSGAGFLSY